MRLNAFVFVSLSFAVFGCASFRNNSSATHTLFAKDLIPYGRTAITKDGLELISSASHFSFSFEGKQCELYVSIAHRDRNYLQYVVDGSVKRIRISKGDKQPIVITAANNGRHKVEVYKTTEATTGPIFIQKITGKHVKNIKLSSAPLIEFIGNSITCGAAADPSEVPCGTGDYHDQHNAYYAYGPRVARAIGANFILSSVSGIGIYRNWNSDGPTMPEVYHKTDFQSSRNWDFKKYQPFVVSIALGTNDFSNGDGKTPRLPFDSAAFVHHYIAFVQQVKSFYPTAQIALLSSPMLSGDRRTLLQNCITAVKDNIDRRFLSGKPVAIYFFKPMQARGCTGHPSVEDHGKLAEDLIPFFGKLLNQ